MKINKGLPIGFVLILLILMAILLPKERFVRQSPVSGNQQETKSSFNVGTEDAVKRNLDDYIQTNGDVEALNTVQVFPDMSGKLVKSYVALGSEVRKGELIAEIDPSTPGVNYSLSPVYAPISGVICVVPLQPGTTVSLSSAVASIGDISSLEIASNIPEGYAGSLKIGLKADVFVDAYPGQRFSATLTRISPVVDPLSRTKEVFLSIENTGGQVEAGMFAKLKLYLKKHENSLSVSNEAVISSDLSSYVFVVNPDGTVS
ncbi:MAG: efflux RND transporter periplasmic adaptor subunit, partial [Sphaerochaetaceae bacterium]|nr:efflux RND transporter periplasmic adaptor subunit [Spirochaetales bacterium]